MLESTFSLSHLLAFSNVMMSSVVTILAFSLMAYTFTYNFRNPVARRFALLLACVMITYASDVALERVSTIGSAERWLRFQWLGIALLPAASYNFALSVLQTTNYRIRRRRWVASLIVVLGVASAVDALLGGQVVNGLRFDPPISYLEAGPYFWLFALYFAVVLLLALGNINKARQRCLTDNSRQRMTYLLFGFIAPGVGVFPYLIGLSRVITTAHSSIVIFLLSLIGNLGVAALLVLMSYTVAYFGVYTPDRVVRYRLLRFFMRGPVVAIFVILAVQTVPTIERLMGLPTDVVLFSVITGVIVVSQLFLSISKTLTDRLVYRQDRNEVAWLRELDRRLLTTTDLRQFLENNLTALCELLRVPSGFVAGVVGSELMLEAVVGADQTRQQVMAVSDWADILSRALKRNQPLGPLSHGGFWIWPLLEPVSNGDDNPGILGVLGVKARTETPLLSLDEIDVLDRMLERIIGVLADRKLQQGVFVTLRRIMPSMEQVQQWRGIVPYTADESDTQPATALLDPSPIHSPEFESWVKDALSHYWGGPKLTDSPLTRLQIVAHMLDQANDDPTKALRLVLDTAIERLKPDGKQNLSAPEWLLYNILAMRFIQGRKVREIADRLAMSESDLYRKQRVAIGQLARVLSEMEQDKRVDSNALGKVDGSEKVNGSEKITSSTTINQVAK